MTADDPRPPLTPRQAEVLHYIRHYILTHRHPPSLRDVAAAVGVNVSAAAGFVNKLAEKDYLRRADGKARSLVVVDAGPDPRAVLRELVRVVRDQPPPLLDLLDDLPEWAAVVALAGPG